MYSWACAQYGTLPLVRGPPGDVGSPSLSFGTPPLTRGDHPPSNVPVTAMLGTPPLARGPPSGDGYVRHMFRNTPAPAGNHAGARRGRPLALGTPPLARGPRRLDHVQPPHLRNTPARAGTTPNRATLVPPHPEHPRSRGDHESVPSEPSMPPGTPPLARGPWNRHLPRTRRSRNTPARAGTTRTPRPGRPVPSEHPRSCGDHIDHSGTGTVVRGTLPLARGPPLDRLPRPRRPRNTPARARTTDRFR
ncbi:hypothetical protein EDD98_4926 [Streptomyces sp. PanSC19]|nr:hypothetical protein EDD98_4926 [Streptomyces sp. PanSC19]